MATFTANHPELLATEVRDIVFQEFTQQPQKFPMILKRKQSTKHAERHQRIAGLGNFSVKREGTAIGYTDPVSGPIVLTVHTAYGNGFRITREMRADDQHEIMSQMPADLGNSARNHQETIAASLVNDFITGTTYTTFDGQPVVSTAHTTLRSATQSNRLNPDSDLNVTGLESITTLADQLQSEEGRYVQAQVDMLLVPPALGHTAKKLLGSEYDITVSGSNAVSTIKSSESGLRTEVWNFLTDAETWFVRANMNQHSACWYDREELEFDSHMDPATKDMLNDAMYRASVVCREWRGWWGSAP
jgi:hypothetical protein